MKRILIYDDNSQHSKDLSELLKKLLSVKTVIDIANNSDKAMELITANSYAVIFLDIELEDRQSGIDFGKTMRQSCKGTSLVFITSYIKYAEDIFGASPDALILKPFSEEGVKRTLELLRQKAEEEDHIYISTGKNDVESIPLGDIECIESSNRKLSFYSDDKEPVYQFYNVKLTSLMSKLPPYFVRCHYSIAVNMKKVTHLERYFFVTESGREVPVSQGRFADTRNEYLSFLGDRL